MKKQMSGITLASIYIGTVIGAGFASGQEIIQFFVRYGKLSILGIFVATILFCILGVKLLQIVYSKKINRLEDFLYLYFKRKTIIFINIWLIGLLFVTFFIMLAGSGAIFKEYFQIDQLYGIIFMAFICFIVLITGVNGIAKANILLIPFLIIIICYIGIYVVYNNTFIFSQLAPDNIFKISEFSLDLNSLIWLGSAILYVAFNSISVIVVFSSLRSLIVEKKCAVYGGVLGGVGLGLMALLINLSLLILYNDIVGLEVPMIAIASTVGYVSKRLYSVVLLVAMFTTAIANGYGCVLRISNLLKINEKITSLLVCCISVPMAALGFKRLVTFFYPIFGYIGVLFLAALIIKGKKMN
ncbi:hypothetical protein [Serpentinicella alkaliphila]|uniref:Putative membrane protein YkvI n=1 Tax=Serpentinicella alkaliphila TaxID=1734049 RepID=A0A4R2TX70_9FIRM|nr:hypothetical protein [Serpentinicella alkaliphila]QUH25160.1 hypothetical protein HZR23_04895 [Serpentinicella alkaliphila]TCQ02249.1 putative membrane protein YkvI [Serpentinicella alkaliphila]